MRGSVEANLDMELVPGIDPHLLVFQYLEKLVLVADRVVIENRPFRAKRKNSVQPMAGQETSMRVGPACRLNPEAFVVVANVGAA